MSVPHIDPAQAIQKMDAGEALVVDVRQPDEHELQRIPGSLLLPLDDINAESAARVLPGHILPGEVIRQPSLSKLRRITVK